MNTTNRNDPCICGSGKKYKKCCYIEWGLKRLGFISREKEIKLLQKALKRSDKFMAFQATLHPSILEQQMMAVEKFYLNGNSFSACAECNMKLVVKYLETGALSMDNVRVTKKKRKMKKKKKKKMLPITN